MASKKASLLSWPFAPREVGLNKDTHLLKLIAMTTMLIDHCGKMFFFQYNIMRIIGRMAFPIYAYCIAVGCVYSKNRLKYLTRIALIGLISQPFYVEALGHRISGMYSVSFAEHPVRSVLNYYVQSWHYPNIMLTLVLGLLVIWTLREKQIVLTCTLILLTWKIQSAVNYGWKGVALIVLFYLFISRWWLSLPIVAAFMLYWGMQTQTYHLFGLRFGLQGFAIMALPLIYIPTNSRIHSKLKINKWVFYLFYPGHLIGMMLVEFAMKLSGG